MRFIENLKGQFQAEELKKEERERRKWEQDKEALRREETERENRQQCLMACDFPHLMKELAEVLNDQRAIHNSAEIDKFYYYVRLYWFKEGDGSFNMINVTAMADWTIKVEGNYWGSTTLKKNDWYGNKDIQEKALEKAFKNPNKNSSGPYRYTDCSGPG